MRGEKWQALGNAYLIVEERELPFALTAARVARLCEAGRGAGVDGVLLVGPAEAGSGAAARVRIFNPDGSEAELSGNGVRQAVLYLHAHGIAARDEFSVQTLAGRIGARITGPGACRLELGRAALRSGDYPSGPEHGEGELEAGGGRWRFRHVQVGNPQCTVLVATEGELAGLDLGRLGPAIERHALFPRRTNVSFSADLADGAVRTRVYERGAGETPSSGTGACGAAVAAVLRGLPSPVTVRLDGGELVVEVGEGLELGLTGPAAAVWRGELSSELVEAVAAL